MFPDTYQYRSFSFSRISSPSAGYSMKIPLSTWPVSSLATGADKLISRRVYSKPSAGPSSTESYPPLLLVHKWNFPTIVSHLPTIRSLQTNGWAYLLTAKEFCIQQTAFVSLAVKEGWWEAMQVLKLEYIICFCRGRAEILKSGISHIGQRVKTMKTCVTMKSHFWRSGLL